ncbi:MAG: acetyl-CoA acetyltransferase [Deltaproteobacteria bacterium RIFCSPLOWO2_02_FULL_50_16]|nr:MAG: acetyl-CoA acetyltransferase [Deltaproteobacteria bacterium GWA2_50_8]OGQ25970.1 MAG: acetyl-CoA acetyltransferase [Deltaproteobacteria bacterium RIFCSPHIGHO2_02_FULL_50_15]OGQ57854.1 MAG: acetyl-CoA acetyltransferase [Deltaproteobacteria bacterium RIFCSPLOWO2_02_FULL_50_16]
MKEAVIVSAVRTAMGRALKGSLVNVRIDDLGALVVREAIRRVSNLDVNLIEDVLIGCAMPEGEQGMNVARNISLLAGLPLSTAAATVNRFCASGLEAINLAVLNIMAGNGDVYVAGGVESMSHVPMGGFNPSLNEKLMRDGAPQAYISMGITAENVAAKYHISRQEQDEYSVHSHQKAVNAIEKGLFKDEILSVEAVVDGKKINFDRDENPRPGTTVEKLSTLKPAFKEGGTVTAGNSSPLTDGAAALILMSLDKAKELGVRPLARIRAMAVGGVDPAYMGMGPAVAVPKALKRAGLTLSDVDVIEFNEAFASQSLGVLRELKLDAKDPRINPKGGAIALGHPLGCTGSRIMTTLIGDLRQANKTIGLESMCIGGGQGCATIVERLS